MKGFAIAFQALHMARSAHAIALESEFRIKRSFNLMRGVAAIANRTPNVTRFEELTMNAFVIDIFNQYVALTARFWDLILANLIRQNYGFYFGTTSTSPLTANAFKFYKSEVRQR